MQTALDVGTALLDASSAAPASARGAQLRAAIDDVRAQLEQQHSGEAGAAMAASEQHSSIVPSREAAAQQGLGVSPDSVAASTRPEGPDSVDAGRPQPTGELPAVIDGGWAARRAAAGAQQRESLLQRQQMPPASPSAEQRVHSVGTQHRAVGNGHVHDSAGADPHESAQPEQTPAPGQYVAAASQWTAVANGRASHSAMKYTALHLRQLRVASAEQCRVFDAACFGDDLRKPPDMVPAMPPPAEDPPA